MSKRASEDCGRLDPDEQEEIWRASVRVHNARLAKENRQAWCEFHRDQAARLRAVFEPLIASHEEQAERYREPKGD
jgi:hypothetical protein